MLDLNYCIFNLRGADYNPRSITEKEQNKLFESIKELGIVKPIIARNNIIVAGHQRTTQLKRMGVRVAPVYSLPCDTSTYDEVRFNQLHNGTDLDSGDDDCKLSGLAGLIGFTTVSPNQISGNLRAKMAAVRKEIARMILKYGSWGSCVATESGEVIHCAQYALAAKLTNSNLTVYVIKDEEKDKYKKYLSKSYGIFSYDHLDKKTYIQTYAQMYRLRGDGTKVKSILYEKQVIPFLKNNHGLRGIDFGSGQGDYAKHLRNQGFDIHDVELFRRVGASNKLDVSAINKMISVMCLDLEKYGQYDYVVCDSVINSVDSLEAENAVLTLLLGLCKPNGTVFFSGRCREFVESHLRASCASSVSNQLVFLDKEGFSGNYRKGHWFYQKYHSKKDVENLIIKYGLRKVNHSHVRSSFQVKVKTESIVNYNDLVKSIEFEFNLPLGDDSKIDRANDVTKAFEKIFS